MADKLYRIRVTDDGYQFLPGEDKEFGQLGRSLMGKDCQIMLREEPKQRSIDQNKYLHAEPFPKVARAMNVSIDEAKLCMMGERFGWHWNSVVARYMPVKPNTRNMTVKQCVEFIEWAPEWAAQMPEPAIILLPNESLWDEDR